MEHFGREHSHRPLERPRFCHEHDRKDLLEGVRAMLKSVGAGLPFGINSFWAPYNLLDYKYKISNKSKQYESEIDQNDSKTLFLTSGTYSDRHKMKFHGEQTDLKFISLRVLGL